MVPMNALLVFGADSLLGADRAGGTRLGLMVLAGVAVVAVAVAGRRVWASGARAQSR
jgi:hypothetical protein